MLSLVQVYNTTSLSEITAKIEAYLGLHPDMGTQENWVIGMGWDQRLLPGGMPTAQDLPADLYVALWRTDFHCLWVSEKVLGLLPNPLPAAPEGGSHPSRGVFCDNAMDLVMPFVPVAGKEVKRGWVLAAQESLHGYGIVGIHDAGVVMEDQDLYIEMADKGELSIRLWVMHECKVRNTYCPMEARFLEREDDLVTVNAVKLYAGTPPTPLPTTSTH